MPIDPLLFRKKHQEEAEGKPILPLEVAQDENEGTLNGVPAPADPSFDSSDGPKDGNVFKQQLDQLDQLIQDENGINSFNMDFVRGYVRLIMTDLKSQPDLDAILIDRDVHNILHFIRTVKDSAVMEKSVKKEKRAVKSAKKPRIKISLGDMPAGLQDLSNLKV